MAEIPSLLGPFGNLIAFGVGQATGPLLRPPIQDLINEAWTLHPVRPIDAMTLAEGVAQGQVDPGWAHDEAAKTGISGGTFDRMIDIANVGPGVASAFELWRRGVIGEPGFRRAVKRVGLEPEWVDDLVLLKQRILSPQELAVMIQRTVVLAPGILPNQPSTAGSNVPPMPTVDLDVLKEAAGSGYNEDRLKALTRIIGLPASPDLAARMHFRKLITEGAFNQAILEGNTRGEWAPFLLDGFREILTTHNYIEARLRGWIDDAEMHAGAALHGMSATNADLLAKIQGRPIGFRQVFIGERRGGVYAGSTTGIDPAILKSLQESNIRPEWYDLADAQKESYPSAFVTRALAQSGDLTADETRRVLMGLGWPEWLVTKVVASWTGGSASGDPHVTKAQTQLWGTTHRSYIADESDDAQATSALGAAGVAATAVPQILALWQHERSLIRRQLTPAQIKKAYDKMATNAATGVAWTRDDALAALIARGYSVTDANDYLNIPAGK